LVDEAYIDFCQEGSSVAPWVVKYPNLIVIQTLSKSFGLAGIRYLVYQTVSLSIHFKINLRLGVSISSPEIAAIFNKTKAPYNISTPSSLMARAALSPDGITSMKTKVAQIKEERDCLIKALTNMPRIGRILGGNDANFLLVEILNEAGIPDNISAHDLWKALAEEDGIVVRYRGNELGCFGCLRISIGTPEENLALLSNIRKRLKKK
jgi:histidinol-phosphate aminotransferase